MRFEVPQKFNIESKETVKTSEVRLFINRNELVELLSYLKNSPECEFDMLKSVSCAQIKDYFEISYYLFSTINKDTIIISTKIDINEAQMPSVVSVYHSSNWDEREIFDLFGINFVNHPNLKRILLPESWLGHPLRKDYQNQDERLRWNYE